MRLRQLSRKHKDGWQRLIGRNVITSTTIHDEIGTKETTTAADEIGNGITGLGNVRKRRRGETTEIIIANDGGHQVGVARDILVNVQDPRSDDIETTKRPLGASRGDPFAEAMWSEGFTSMKSCHTNASQQHKMPSLCKHFRKTSMWPYLHSS